MNYSKRTIDVVIKDALAITKLSRTGLTDVLKEPLGSTIAGRKLLNSRDFSMNDIHRLREALQEL
jgi:hypothetical protein